MRVVELTFDEFLQVVLELAILSSRPYFMRESGCSSGVAPLTGAAFHGFSWLVDVAVKDWVGVMWSSKSSMALSTNHSTTVDWEATEGQDVWYMIFIVEY